MAGNKNIEISPELLDVFPKSINGNHVMQRNVPIALRSAEANEMMERTPSWLMRWGMISVIGVFVLLFSIALLIEYPDTIEGSAIITTDPLPIRLKASNTGRIAQLFVADGVIIQKGEPIAEIENNTGYLHINLLQGLADSLSTAMQQNDVPCLQKVLHEPLYSLGEAQPFYNILLQQLSAYLLLKDEHIYERRTHNLQQQIQRYQSVAIISNTERKLVDEELRQSNERFASNEKLYRDKVISKMEYYDEAAKLRQRQLAFESQRRTALQNNITKGDNQKQLLEMQYDKADKERVLRVNIEEALRNLCNYIQTWKLQYLIVAPFDGTARYLKPLQQNEAVNAGDELFAIIPGHYHYTALVNLPSAGSGKVQQGQQVHLLLPKFPYQEYGYLEGTVSGISILPLSTGKDDKEQMYRVVVQLPDSLVTSYHKRLAFTPEMAANARIITQDRNLLQRMMDGVMGLKK